MTPIPKTLVAGIFWCLSNVVAFANVPIEDAAQLGKKTETSASTIKLVPIVEQHDVGRKAINCAVTKPGKGAVKNPAVAPDAAAGAAVAQKYGAPAAVAGATGPDLAGQTLGTQTGAVVSGARPRNRLSRRLAISTRVFRHKSVQPIRSWPPST